MFGGFHQELLVAWDYFMHLAVVLIPLFIGGSFLVGLLQEYLPPERVERILRRYDGGSGNVVAAGTGAITPFCSASTVPVLAGLLGAGAPLGIAFSFLLASPLVNELAVILLFGLFGFKTTALYVGFTSVAAIIGGIVIGRLDLEHHIKDTQLLTPDDGNVVADGGRSSNGCETGAPQSGANLPPDACSNISSAQSAVGCGQTARQSTTHWMRVKRAATGARGFFVGLLPYLVLGMTLGAVIHAFVPASIVHQLIGPENPLAVFIAAVAGAPIYVSMSAMLPVAATFTNQGIPIGTVLAFVIGSAGVSLPNLILLNKLFDRTLLTVYTLTVVTTGIVVGILFNSSLL
jgi:uncharacterized membrane protein YraQ (UPF0718 family)